MSEYTPPADVAAQINAMVSAAGARVEALQRLASNNGTQGQVRVGHDGNVTGSVLLADRIADDGRDFGVERANDQRRIDDLQAKLDAHTFNTKTGAKVLVAQGRLRELIEMELMSAKTNAIYADSRYAQIEAQRVRDQRWRDAENEERATYLRVTGGDPRKVARLEELLGDEELKVAAQAILAARFERGRG